ncbi:sugar phosphate isomerase/epimerase family protein [Chitinophaga rhizophila]|uniref:Sugar phosphate isomerase/epimerase n=1 Tax=Chitinophaga rhizophila TaxID=2866212 RepID=A0ABS7GB56_9BACT|nr:sugar phosphate isomerase/epimerase family protein [Chitinophaga rhizophila]MBW8683773.1 sugar phosphate isomerase/epimerase [Chitinophaga rhizophila]
MKNYYLLLFFATFFATMQSNAQVGVPRVGVCGSKSNDSLLHAAGYVYIEESVQKLLSPAVPEDTFRLQLAQLRKLKCQVQACNSFFPADIRLTGPDVDEKKVLNYVNTVMARAKQADIRLIVLGSGNSRKLPDGLDKQAATAQFIDLCRKIAGVAKKYNVVVAIENLNTTETNFVTTLEEANNVVTAVAHPNFKLTADIYHMLKEHESPEMLKKASKNLVHCHIAEREKRTAPGATGNDVAPYMVALGSIGYTGRISLECRWDNLQAQSKPTMDYMQQQIKTAYNK